MKIGLPYYDGGDDDADVVERVSNDVDQDCFCREVVVLMLMLLVGLVSMCMFVFMLMGRVVSMAMAALVSMFVIAVSVIVIAGEKLLPPPLLFCRDIMSMPVFRVGSL